jgi:RNA polymerase sigma-70 factor (ECF subfamily)
MDQLVQDCKRQDRKAQELVFRQFGGRMLGVCMRYISDKSEAEEVMLIGFTKVFSKIDQFSGEGSFEGWIRRIMVNESLNHLRKYKNLKMQVDLETNEYMVPGYVDAHKVDQQYLMDLITELPDGYRTVFNLYAVEGYSHKEIAEELGITESTSKSQLSRARLLLQKKLNAHDAQSEKVFYGT